MSTTPRGSWHQLSLFPQKYPPPRDAISPQETNISTSRLSQYNGPTQDSQSHTAFLVLNSHTAKPHRFSQTIPDTSVEVVYTCPTRPSVCILNIYSPPNEHLKTVEPLFQEAVMIAGSHPLLFLGHFKAPPPWT
ncbi:hypothetical protein HPB48_010813 [Haemaphysalis longicornis]|uniref:Uncharacterized protein n=1 Tax=Haemaphysalis longicornis TaxID=44386 RepID=A0A9J6FXU1_HAELO|nr:hypothetical protein HPB48_010813 [Haemaphysalis longicornis]